MSSGPPHRVRFGTFEADLRSGELRKQGLKIKLNHQPFEVLRRLVENPGELVPRDELRNRLWSSEVYVDFDRSLNKAIAKLREALADSAESPRFIETLPRQGYRFIAPVEVLEAPATLSSAAPVQRIPAAPVIPVRNRRVGRHGLLMTGSMLGLLALGAVGWRVRWAQTMPSPVGSLAVLPLTNLSGDPSQDYLADGMTDELITSLAGIRSLHVISRTTTTQYKGTHSRLPKIAQELNVEAVVEGSVARSGERVRITVQLIQARTDRHLWARRYDGDMRDLLALESDVARSIAGEVRAVLTPAEQVHLAKATPFKPEAYEAYLKGRYYWNDRTKESLQKSLHLFEQAIQKDPRNPLPYAGLADAYNMSGNYHLLPPAQAFPKAETAARKALEMDDSLAEAHASLGFARYQYDWDWSGAEHEFRRAIELKPNYATAHQWYAEFLAANARFDEALAEIRYAQELDPLSLAVRNNIGRVLYLARRYDQAIDELKNSIELHPKYAYARLYLALAYEQKQMYPQAKAEFAEASRLLELKYAAGHAHIDALLGRRREAEQILKHLEGPLGQGTDPFLLAGVYAALGNRDKAFALLDRAYEERSFLICFIKAFPWMDPLRPDPRFSHLLSRMGLTQQ